MVLEVFVCVCMVLTVFSGHSPNCSVQQYPNRKQQSQNGKITRGPVWIFVLCFPPGEYEQPVASQCQRWGNECEEVGVGGGGENVQGESEAVLVVSRALVVEVGLFDAPAEGQQVAVALDPLCQLAARQPGGEHGEEVAEHQRVQLRRPAGQKAFFFNLLLGVDMNAGLASDTMTDADTLPPDAAHKLKRVSTSGLTGSLKEIFGAWRRGMTTM